MTELYLLLIPAGFLAGVVNAIAGGGSFLTLPVLMYLCGLNAQMANGTNRVAILFSTFSASAEFHRQGTLDKKLLLRLVLPTLVGVPLGALIATRLPIEAFRPLLGGVFLSMATLFSLRSNWLLRPGRSPVANPIAEVLLFFGIGVYVGFIQAGMGALVLLGIGLFHARDLVEANAVKNVLAFVLTVPALAIFAFQGQIAWGPGLMMAIGNTLGGHIGARLSLRKGHRFVFAILVLVMFVTGVELILSGQ